MVSLDTIEDNFRSFISRISEKKGRKLNKNGLHNFSIQAEILKGLLEGKGFIIQVEKLDKIKRSVLSKGIIGDGDIRSLNKILDDL